MLKLKSDPDDLDKEISRLLSEMADTDTTTEEYADLTMRVETLLKQQTARKSTGLSPNTILVVAGNILGIVAMLAFESDHVLTKKALGFIMKPKL